MTVLSNSCETASQHSITDALAAIVFSLKTAPPTPLRAVAIPDTLLASYAGSYQYGADYFNPNAKFTLTAKAGFLLMEIGDQHAPLVPLSQTDFLERKFFGHIVLSKDAEGKVTGLTCSYGDNTIPGGGCKTHNC